MTPDQALKAATALLSKKPFTSADVEEYKRLMKIAAGDIGTSS